MRGIPRLGRFVILQALPVVVADHHRALRRARVVLAGPILARRECFALSRRSREDVMTIGLVAATVMPLALTQGPLPMRSRAFTAPSPCVDRYACQVLLPAPADAARSWQCLSAPANPPRSAPLPGPWLVTKKLMLACCAAAGAAQTIAKHAASGTPNLITM